MYTLTSGTTIVRDADQANIPDDHGNSDYQAYQLWLAAGNTPNPAPEIVAPIVTPPTLSQLQSQLAALTAQINALVAQS